MALIVQKFGGTSVGTTERIQAAAEKVAKFVKKGDQIVVVVSAMSGETNRLLALAKEINEAGSPREIDVLLSTGEQATIALFCMALDKLGCAARSFTGGQVKIVTDNTHSKARIKRIDHSRIKEQLNAGKVVVVAGFQGVDELGNITTLGRGGSDTSAVAIAAAIKADECQIYTDVDGVYTTDPRVCAGARKLDQITFEEMLEMASQGSKVLQIRSVEFAGKYKVPLRVLSSFKEGKGTLISLEENTKVESPVVSGIAFNREEAKITIAKVPEKPGVAARILSVIAAANIEVDVIVQNVAHGESNDFSFTVHRNDLKATKQIIERLKDEIGYHAVYSDSSIAKVSLVGVGMRSHAGVAATMFESLAKEGINIQIITTSEIKITVIIDERYLELAVRGMHSAFGLESDPTSE